MKTHGECLFDAMQEAIQEQDSEYVPTTWQEDPFQEIFERTAGLYQVNLHKQGIRIW